MKLAHTIHINANADRVWKVLAIEFDKASEWMASVPSSTLLDHEPPIEGAHMAGRTCTFGTAENAPMVEETFTYYSNAEKRFNLLVKPITGKLPIVQNHARVFVESVSPDHSIVHWDSDISLTFSGKVMKPILKIGLTKNLQEILEELKFYVEHQKVHPRKTKALQALH